MTIKTEIGFEFEVDTDKVLDYEFSYLVGSLQTDDAMEQLKDSTLLLNKILGSKDEVMRFFAHVKEKNNGIVENKIVTDFIKEVITKMGNNKKK